MYKKKTIILSTLLSIVFAGCTYKNENIENNIKKEEPIIENNMKKEEPIVESNIKPELNIVDIKEKNVDNKKKYLEQMSVKNYLEEEKTLTDERKKSLNNYLSNKKNSDVKLDTKDLPLKIQEELNKSIEENQKEIDILSKKVDSLNNKPLTCAKVCSNKDIEKNKENITELKNRISQLEKNDLYFKSLLDNKTIDINKLTQEDVKINKEIEDLKRAINEMKKSTNNNKSGQNEIKKDIIKKDIICESTKDNQNTPKSKSIKELMNGTDKNKPVKPPFTIRPVKVNDNLLPSETIMDGSHNKNSQTRVMYNINDTQPYIARTLIADKMAILDNNNHKRKVYVGKDIYLNKIDYFVQSIDSDCVYLIAKNLQNRKDKICR